MKAFNLSGASFKFKGCFRLIAVGDYLKTHYIQSKLLLKYLSFVRNLNKKMVDLNLCSSIISGFSWSKFSEKYYSRKIRIYWSSLIHNQPTHTFIVMLFSMSMNRISLCVLLTSAFGKGRYFLLQFFLLLEFFRFLLPVARTDRLQFVSLHYKVDLWVSDLCRTAFIDHIRNKTEFFITSLSNFGFVVMWIIGIHFACTRHKRNHSASRPTVAKAGNFCKHNRKAERAYALLLL